MRNSLVALATAAVLAVPGLAFAVEEAVNGGDPPGDFVRDPHDRDRRDRDRRRREHDRWERERHRRDHDRRERERHRHDRDRRERERHRHDRDRRERERHRRDHDRDGRRGLDHRQERAAAVGGPNDVANRWDSRDGSWDGYDRDCPDDFERVPSFFDDASDDDGDGVICCKRIDRDDRHGVICLDRYRDGDFDRHRPRERYDWND
jgi:hypothetical protein